jgi:hypothetical protein
MALTSTERQRLWRDRHRGEPRGNKVLMAQLTALQAHVAQLEAELAARPRPAPRKPPGQDAVAALKQERDELAVQLAQIEAYQPRVTAKAWVAEIDKPPRRRR